MPTMPITEKLLMDAAGWQVVKHARTLVEMQRVVSARYEPPLLRGAVREGATEYRCGLKIDGPTRVENLCTCRASRAEGRICAHSVAVGLGWLRAREREAAESAPVLAKPAAGPGVAAAPPMPVFPDAGAAARLHLVLPPNLSAAWQRGQITVGLELAMGPQRALLGAFTKGRRVGLRGEDFAPVEFLARRTGSFPNGMLVLERGDFLALVDALPGHPRVTLGRSQAVRISREGARLGLVVTMHPDGGCALAVELPPGEELLAARGTAWLWDPAGPRLTPAAPGLPAAYAALFTASPLRLPPAQAGGFLAQELPALREFLDVRAPAGAVAGAALDVEPEVPAFSLEVEGSLNHLDATLQAIYGPRIVTVGVTPEREQWTRPDPLRPGRLLSRNLPAEHAALARFHGLGFRGPDTRGSHALKGQDAILRFFAGGIPALEKTPGWTVRVGARFQRVTDAQVETLRPEVDIRGSGENWFDLSYALVASGSGERFDSHAVARLLQGGGSTARLRNGKLAVFSADLLDDFRQVLLDADPAQPRPGVFRVARAQAGYLDSALTALTGGVPPAWEEYRRGVRELSPPPPVTLPAALDAVLRPYQREGVAWLAWLSHNGLGGVLADEMGLGKTVQALAWMSHRRSARVDSPHLVVAPTTLLENWRREAARFTPDFRVTVLHGPQRAQKFEEARAADLVLTSYALLRRDGEAFHHGMEYAGAILDEAHYIKNPDSQTARAAFALRARDRWVLTGTPMENSVRDVWSVLQFALPGYLGKRDDFRERYELPLARGDADPATHSRLARRLRPVLLRRRKRDVAKDLPEKIEQVAWCEMTTAQSAAYRDILEASRRKIDDLKDEKQGRMLVLTTLLRLRQACCDLRLLGLETTTPSSSHGANGADKNAQDLPDSLDDESTPPPPDATLSGKLAALDELIEQVREGGHRVLIFSQFTSMLRLLAEHLDGRGVPHAYLDGSTRDRQAQVDRFQSDPSLTAFLISLKAGGVGLNLTAADTVVHFDPWWNPAAEAQAADRAHRIGQMRVVTVYQLITRGTVEEKILALQRRKREAVAAVVGGEDAAELTAGLTLAEMRELLT